MRNTPEVARKAYFKTNIKCEQTEGMSNYDPVPKVDPYNPPTIPKPIKKKLKDPRQSAKEYREKNKEKIKAYKQTNKDRINRTKLLWSLNNFKRRPRQSTLDKYNIEYSDSLQRYIHKS